MDKPLVYVIVVNWNLKDVTLECLESLRGLRYPNVRIVVVDNNSHDGSPAVIAARYPEVEQILHTENRGSTAGYNAGFRHALKADAEFAMVINNDAIIAPDALDLLVEACMPQSVGMTGPLIYYADHPDTVWSAGAMRSRLNIELKGNHGRNQAFTTVSERDFLTSCVLLCKCEIFNKIGLMDEDFFVYHEEHDYTFRARKAGYRILLVPQAKAWHKVGLSSGSGTDTPTKRYWMAKNQVLYLAKNALWWQWFFILPWRTGSAVKTTWRLIRHKNWKSLRSYWRGLYDGIRFQLGKAKTA
jgi:GT2 family glycosyltransferase